MPSLGQAFAIADVWVRDGIVPGVSIAVARHGELLETFTAGKRAAGGGGPVDASTLYSIASVTKPFTAALVMRLVERGAITLDEPIRRLVPSLPTEQRELNLRDLLRHTSGLAKDDPGEAELWTREASFDELVASAAAIPSDDTGGIRVRYSNNGYWISGAAAAAANGTTFAEAMREHVLEPFGLTETLIAPDESIQDHAARRYGKAKIMNAPYGRQLASPAGGLFATARDLVRFASIVLNDGRDSSGFALLSRPSIDLMTTNQTGTLPGGIEGFIQWSTGSWALGWEVKGRKTHHWTGDLTSPATFAHPGQSGCLLWADPATGLACAILANRDLYTGWTITPARWARISNAIVAGAMA
ncbi:MAG: serine hydrolase domain-containing protein [Thermomicrobiales bacterium]